jgi:hypothetical protein
MVMDKGIELFPEFQLYHVFSQLGLALPLSAERLHASAAIRPDLTLCILEEAVVSNSCYPSLCLLSKDEPLMTR